MGRFSAAAVVAVAAAATALLACPADAKLVGSARQADVAAAVLDDYPTEEALVDVGFETAEQADDFLGEEELPAETEAVLGEEELPAETEAVLGEEELPAETEAVLGEEELPAETEAVLGEAIPTDYPMPDATEVLEAPPMVYPTHTPYPTAEAALETPMVSYPTAEAALETPMVSYPTAEAALETPMVSYPTAEAALETPMVYATPMVSYPTHTPYPSEEVAVEPMASYPVQTVMPYSMPTAVVQEGKPVYSGPRKFAPTLAAAQQMTYDAYMRWLAAMPAPYVPIQQQQKPVYTPVTKKVVVAKQPVLVQAPRPVKPLAAVQQLPFLVPHGQGQGRPGPRVVTASGVTSYSTEVSA